MKIGEVALKYNISIDTIRYYISLGLLNPEKKNGQSNFSSDDIKDLEFLLYLKGLHFTLKESEALMRNRRICYGTEQQSIKLKEDIFLKKKYDLIKEKEEIMFAIKSLDKELNSISSAKSPIKNTKTGVPILAMDLLACPCCNKKINKIESGILSSKYILSGKITCECGYHADIENGVIKTGNVYTGVHDSPDYNRNLYGTLCDDMLKMHNHATSYITKKLQEINITNKVVLEGTVNGYFYLYNHLKFLPKDCIYIITDKYYEMLLMYKEMIECQNLNLNIIYIADNKLDLPIAKSSIDVLIENFGENEWQFYNEEYFSEGIMDLLKSNSIIVGGMMDIDDNSTTMKKYRMKYPDSSSRLYNFRKYQKYLKDNHYNVESDLDSVITKTQNTYSFTCHTDGENLNGYLYIAKRGNE